MCEICGEDFEFKQSRKKVKFCSKKCKDKSHSKNMLGKLNPAWLGGIINQKYCNLFNEFFKEFIREQYYRKCYLCNKTEIQNNNRKLSVHHVNYDKNSLCNHNGEFVPLCGSCHIKTNHNRQYWEDLIMGYLYPNRYFIVDI